MWTSCRELPELATHHGLEDAYPYVNEAVYTCLRNASVYMDGLRNTGAPMVDVYVRAMNDLIPDKIYFFASAHPLWNLLTRP